MTFRLSHVLTKVLLLKFKKIYPESSFLELYQLLTALENRSHKLKNSTGLAQKALVEANVSYLVSVVFSRSNTRLTLSTSSGKLLFSQSAGAVGFKSSQKKNRIETLKKMLTKLNEEFDNSAYERLPACLQLSRVGVSKLPVVRLVKRFFLIASLKSFNSVPYNGCRKKKPRRKKRKSLIIR